MRKNIVKVAFVIIGTLVGAGFASGKEIYSFFFVYGEIGIFGMVLSNTIIGYVIYKVFKICSKNNINTYYDFCESIGNSIENRKLPLFLNNMVNIFLVITFFVMVAGFSSFLNQEFYINRLIGSMLIIVICFFIFLNNINGLIKLSNYLIPILIVLIVYLSLKNTEILENFNRIFNSNTVKYNSSRAYEGVLKSVLYASYNSIILIPVLIPLTKIVNRKSYIRVLVFFSVFLLLILSFAIYNLLLQGDSAILSLEMPIIGVVKKYEKICKIAYIGIIGISILTSAVSAGCGFLNNCSHCKKEFKRNLIAISVAAVVVSQIKFSTFVNLLYPVLGVIGIIEIALLQFNKK